MDRWVGTWVGGSVARKMDGWVSLSKDGWMNELVGVDRCMGGWIDGWVN